METFNERIKQLIENKGFTPYHIAKESGVSEATLSRFINNESSKPSIKVLQTLSNYFDVNEEWLLNGTGKKQNESIKTKNGNEFIDVGNGFLLMKVPLMEIGTQAGFADNYQDVEFLANIDSFHTIIVKEVHKGRYVAFRTVGDSMNNGKSDAILPNDIVTGRELQRHHWTGKLWYNKYKNWIIATTESTYPLLKEIVSHDVENGIIVCHSRNDSPEYKDFEIHLDSVTVLFYVVDISRKLVD